MNKTDWFNILGIVAALGLATAATFAGGTDNRILAYVGIGENSFDLTVEYHETDDGQKAVRSADGVAVPVGDYDRILTASSMAADALLEVASPNRILAIPQLLSEAPYAYRYGDVKTIAQLSNIEKVLSLEPDLVVYHKVVQTDVAARLREQGVKVFDLGSPTGAKAWAEDVVTFGALLGVEERARKQARTYLQRLESIASDVGKEKRPGAMVVTSYGEQFFGGASGTSYHDVLVYAGLKDIASEFKGWPQYDPEKLMKMNPEWIVTSKGMATAICSHTVLEHLQACTSEPAHVIVVPQALFSDPGLRILGAAEYVHQRVFHGSK